MSGAIRAIAVFDGKNKWKLAGTVIFEQEPRKNTVVTVNLVGFPRNHISGFHIHEWGDMSQGCKSMGPHYNPYNHDHGNCELVGKKRHVGDLVNNLYANDIGHVHIHFEDDLVQLRGKYSIIGRGLVIHDKMDDLGKGGPLPTSGNKESLLTGNAGGRVACTVIALLNN
jgi:Cu-Zn family superoxide dismutase